MIRRIFLAAVLAGGCAPAAREPSPASAATLAAEIEAQFRRAASDWNRGDLDAFMADYEDSPSTSFVSGGRLRRGRDRIRAGYEARFRPGAQRDSLRFEDFDVRPLGDAHALVFARFVLHRGDSTTSTGPFTLVMARRADGWKILHDHTSSD
jgi:uncharacterized protein (TIGR02246 family)